jgi:hypothetical protein
VTEAVAVNVDVASNQRAKQQPEGRTRADTDACVGVAKDPELDQNDHNNQGPDEKRKERRVSGK